MHTRGTSQLKGAEAGAHMDNKQVITNYLDGRRENASRIHSTVEWDSPKGLRAHTAPYCQRPLEPTTSTSIELIMHHRFNKGGIGENDGVPQMNHHRALVASSVVDTPLSPTPIPAPEPGAGRDAHPHGAQSPCVPSSHASSVVCSLLHAVFDAHTLARVHRAPAGGLCSANTMLSCYSSRHYSFPASLFEDDRVSSEHMHGAPLISSQNQPLRRLLSASAASLHAGDTILCCKELHAKKHQSSNEPSRSCFGSSLKNSVMVAAACPLVSAGCTLHQSSTD